MGVISWGTLSGVISRGTLGGVSLSSKTLSSLVSSHLLVYLLQVQLPQVYTGRMLDEVPPQEFETLEVPTEQDRAVLIIHLEGFNEPGSNCLELILGA